MRRGVHLWAIVAAGFGRCRGIGRARVRRHRPSLRVEADLTQFCVIASIPKPGPNTAIERTRTTAYHVVAIARAGFGLSFTPSAVLRDSTGKLLSRGSSYPTRSALCRA